LIDNALDRDGEPVDDDKKEEFRAYNAFSFEGGGSAFVFEYKLGKAANGNDFTGYSRTKTTTKGKEFGGNAGFALDIQITPGFYVDFQIGGGGKKATMVTEISDVEDESHVAFSLADPEFGDYFVVTVWEVWCSFPASHLYSDSTLGANLKSACA
jgi:hypothetical protein